MIQGEEYKLFWPEQPEFVRMAARLGATIVPFGVVGEDDLTEVLVNSVTYFMKSTTITPPECCSCP